jgi:hypothetical protein
MNAPQVSFTGQIIAAHLDAAAFWSRESERVGGRLTGEYAERAGRHTQQARLVTAMVLPSMEKAA